MKTATFLTTIATVLLMSSCGDRAGNAGTPRGSVIQTTQPSDTTNTQPANTATAGLNPAHGMPGHRCDIPEGAPLNQAPANITTQVTPVSGGQNAATEAQQPIPSTAKTNPQHGEPGHRCDLPVGAPLPQ